MNWKELFKDHLFQLPCPERASSTWSDCSEHYSYLECINNAFRKFSFIVFFFKRQCYFWVLKQVFGHENVCFFSVKNNYVHYRIFLKLIWNKNYTTLLWYMFVSLEEDSVSPCRNYWGFTVFAGNVNVHWEMGDMIFWQKIQILRYLYYES